jgi:hypothetical protein
MMSERRVEVLVFDGCPNVDATLARARAAVAATKVRAEVRLVRVESDEEAKRLRFLGSPTVRVDDEDVDRSAKLRDDFGLQCRIYSVDGRFEGTPPTEWIASALRGDFRTEVVPIPAACAGCCSRRGES